MSAPRLTIGLPVKDGAAFLGRTLESLASQSFGDFELVVSDNASSDATPEIVRELAARDARVRYVRQPEDRGAAENFNRVAREARGELFKWAASDDECAPGFLADCVEALDRSDSCVLAFPRTRWIDAESRTIEDMPAPRWDGSSPASRLASLWREPRDTHLLKCSPICGVIRTDVLRSTRLIGPFGSADKVTLVELALRGDWGEVPRPHFLRRVHAGSSLEANKSPEEVARWFDPNARIGAATPRARLFHAYRAAIAAAPLTRAERRRCRAELMRLLRREWRVIGGEYRRALRARLWPGSAA